MIFKHGKHYRVIKQGASLERFATDEAGKATLVTVPLEVGTVLEYVGEDYDAVDYDVVPMPYFAYQGQHFSFQPSSFSGQIPAGWLEEA